MKYKKGSENGAIDALSRIPVEQEATQRLQAMSSLQIPDWVEQLRAENQSDPWLQRIHTQLLHQEAKTGFQAKDNLLFYNNRFCVGPSSSLWTLIFTELHGSRMGDMSTSIEPWLESDFVSFGSA